MPQPITLMSSESKPHNLGEFHVDFSKLHVDCQGIRYQVIDIKEQPKFQGPHWKQLQKKCEDLKVPVAIFEPFQKYQAFTFWPVHPQHGLLKPTRMLADHFIKKYNLTFIDHVSIGDSSQKELLGWLLKRGVSIRRISCFPSENPKESDDVANILYSDEFLLKCTQGLTSMLETSDDFIPQNLRKGVQLIGQVMILKAPWVDAYELQRIQGAIIQLRGSRLTNEDLNAFLKRWESGRHSEKKQVSIRLEEGRKWDFGEILKGLDDGFEIIQSDRAEDQRLTIERKGGKSAFITLSKDGRHFQVLFSFPDKS